MEVNMKKQQNINDLFVYHKKEEYDDIYNEDIDTILKDKNYSSLDYSFKFYFTDGSFKIGNGKSKTPLGLVNDFDGLIPWDEFDSLHSENCQLTTKDILKIAIRAYAQVYKNIYRIEIINIKTNKVIDFIE